MDKFFKSTSEDEAPEPSNASTTSAMAEFKAWLNSPQAPKPKKIKQRRHSEPICSRLHGVQKRGICRKAVASRKSNGTTTTVAAAGRMKYTAFRWTSTVGGGPAKVDRSRLEEMFQVMDIGTATSQRPDTGATQPIGLASVVEAPNTAE